MPFGPFTRKVNHPLSIGGQSYVIYAEDVNELQEGVEDTGTLLAGGATGQVLTKLSGTTHDVGWGNVAGSLSDLIQGKGDLFVGSATQNVGILNSSAVTTGYVLAIDPSAPLGVRWVPPSEGGDGAPFLLLIGGLFSSPALELALITTL